ncbi:MAG TPA: glycine cleavage system aminomethyltransferase GcvT [Candidatus Polarisedimenticolia bacterium]|nr:glycine cleavage system aminomethyltransferase GcvT [Candidatus Polarisedimenticolia bacterium]
MKDAAAPLKKTPLSDLFREMGARLVDFAGWEMPVQFSSLLEEHRAVRGAAGVFDVSHMGEIEVRGRSALAVVQRLTCNDAARLAPGQAQYSALTTESGTFVDDILVYRRGPEHFLLVVNASNTGKDFDWIAARAAGEVEVVNVSARWAQIAVQGPRAQDILKSVAPLDWAPIRYYHFVEAELLGGPALVSRTGYTGEDGFEIYLPPPKAPDLYRAILRAGTPLGLLPCGLGARDTLRLEAGMPLYGNDIDETTTVLEAGLGGVVRFEKGEFLGREALLRQKSAGVSRSLKGFEMIDPGIARHGYQVKVNGEAIGLVTSGSFAPHVRKNIGLTYVPSRQDGVGTRIQIDVRGRDAAAVIVPTPFYRRPR